LDEHITFIFRAEEYAKQETSTKQAKAACLLCLLFNLGNVGNKFPQNTRWLSMDYMALYPSKHNLKSYTKFKSLNLNVRNHLEILGIVGRKILKWII
jgi:hypothetical protein